MVYPLTTTTKNIQEGSNITPIVRVEFANGAKLDTLDPTDGLRSVELIDEFMSSRGTIIASPESILSWLHPTVLPTYKGTKVKISIGFIGTTQSIQLAPLFVGSVYSVSTPGGIVITFNLISWWELLAGKRVARDPATADAVPPVWDKDTTVLGILNELLTVFAPVFLDNSDGIVPIYKPYYEAGSYEGGLTVVRNLMDMTRSYIKLRADGFHVLYPRPTDPTSQLYSLLRYPFQMKSLTSTLVIPNTIIVVSVLPTSELGAPFVGIAQDSDSVAKVGSVEMIVLDEGISSLGEANARAQILLSRIQSTGSEGVMQASVHIGQELFDKVDVSDERTGGGGSSHRVGRIKRLWRSGQFIMELGFGGLAPHLSGLQTYPNDFGEFQPIIGPPSGVPIGSGPIFPPGYIPPGSQGEDFGELQPPVGPPPSGVPIIGAPFARAVWPEQRTYSSIPPQLDAAAGRSYSPVSSTPGAITGRRHRETWFILGTIGTATAQGVVPKVHGGRWRIVEAGARVKIAPTGSNIVIDIEYQLVSGGPWKSVFTNSFSRLVIAAGATEALSGTIDPGLILPLTTILRMNTNSTASPLGADLTVELDSSIRIVGQ